MKSYQATLRAAAMMAVCAGLGAPLAPAQEARHSDTYGTATTTSYVLQAFAFDPDAGDSANVIANGFYSRSCSTNCNLVAPVMLPAGAIIQSMELEACDTNPAGEITVPLLRYPQLEAPFQNLGSIATGVGATPGCAFFNVNLPAPHTVNNETGTYVVRVNLSGATIATRFQAVRLVYRLQVSPAPGTATFPNDVPTTHPFFRFVEALAAAGITGGCAPGSYCPNSPVTRGEMAVFLASALGLHFPN